MTTTDRSSTMPLNDRDLRVLRELTAQVKRIADALNTPAEEVDDALTAPKRLCTCPDSFPTAQHPEPCPLSREPYASELAAMHGTDAPLPPDNGARIVPRVMLPGAEEHAKAFQQWLHDNTPQPWPPYKMCSASTDGAFGRPVGPCVLRYQHDGPVHQNGSGTTWANNRAGDGDTAALDRVIDVIHQYEEWCLAGYTACQPIDVVRQLRGAVDGKPVPPGWKPGKPTS